MTKGQKFPEKERKNDKTTEVEYTMKKAFAISLALAMMLTLVACGGNTNKDNSPSG